MKQYFVLAAVILGLLLLLVEACNNRTRPFKDWRHERWERRDQQRDDSDERRFFVRPNPSPDTEPSDQPHNQQRDRHRLLPWRKKELT